MDYSLLSQRCPLSFGLLVASQSSWLLWSCLFTFPFLVELKHRVSPPLPSISGALFLLHHICWQSFLWCYYLSHWLFGFELIFPWWISLCLYCWFSWFFFPLTVLFLSQVDFADLSVSSFMSFTVFTRTLWKASPWHFTYFLIFWVMSRRIMPRGVAVPGYLFSFYGDICLSLD